MRKWRAVLAVSLGAVALAGPAFAKGPACAEPEEVFPIDTAIIQQELMVAALTCHEVERFNAFQRGYGPELRDSDARLLRMFRRLYGARRGEAAYHSFKTKAANGAEMRSIHDNAGYCAEAGGLLSAALVPMKPPLVTFVSASQFVILERPVSLCLLGGPRPADAVPEKRHVRHLRRK